MILGPGIPGLSTGPSTPKGGCPACARPDGIARFNWRLSLEDPHGEFHPYTGTLQGQKRLKRGSLLKCPSCGRKWWLDGTGEMAWQVPRERLLLLERWNSTPLGLSPSMMEKIRAIGATPPHDLSTDRNFCQVPCRAVTREGSLDKCLLVFQEGPPLGPHPPRLLDEILDLAPSDFALPREVRVATAHSKMTPKGQAPTPIQVGKRTFPLNWVVNFLDRDGMKGSNAKLAEGKAAPKMRGQKAVSEPLEGITFFFGDWSEELGNF